MKCDVAFRAVALAMVLSAAFGQMAHMGEEHCGEHHESRYHHLVSLEAAKIAPMEAFTTWVTHHAKEYKDNVQEFALRFEIFKDNLEYILAYNKEHDTHWLHLNAFADLTNEEFGKYYTGLKVTDEDLALRAARNKAFRYADVEAKGDVDWVKDGAVTGVKNQGQCGSCWAFSTTGSMEGANFLETGELISLSEQELVDCDPNDMGCNGGLMDNAFKYIVSTGGLDTEKDYPYKGVKGTCNQAKSAKHVVSIDDFEDVPPMSEKALMKAVTKQPVSVAIQADERAFQLYGGGVLDAQCGTQLDHGVLVAGYSVDGNYWLIKNSWGDWWGEKGYIRLAMGKNGGYGQCGLCSLPSFPVKTSPNPPPTPPGPPPAPTPAPPGPIQCDSTGTFQCEADQTCCCEFEISGYCLMYACCPYPEATCCDDKKSCCPSDHPICDVEAGQCKASADNSFDVVEMRQKERASKRPKFLDNVSRKAAIMEADDEADSAPAVTFA